MWFRNIILYRYDEPFYENEVTLAQALMEKQSRPLSNLAMESWGWEPPLGDGGELVHVANGRIMVCAMKKEKVLPPAVVKEVLQERITERENRDGRKIKNKEKAELRDNIIAEMLPKAFTKSSLHYAYIDPINHWVVVDASSPSTAETLLSLLRDSLGSLPAVPAEIRDEPRLLMTRWLRQQGEMPNGLTIGYECELRDEEGGIIRAKNEDLNAEEIQTLVDTGKKVTALSLEYDDRMAFVLNEKGHLKRLKFYDAVLEETAEVEAESPAEQFDADFALSSAELSRLFVVLYGESQ